MCHQAELRHDKSVTTAPLFTAPAGTSAPPECVPPGDISISAYKLAHSNLPLPILNHSLRVYLYSKWIAGREQSWWSQPDRLPLLFVACILHDVGCAARFDGPQRFEVEGADAAATHLQNFCVPTADIHEVWQAIALHTSPQIAERISPMARLLRASVLIDFNELGVKAGRRLFDSLSENGAVAAEAVREHLERLFPRLEPEKILGDTVVEQALRQREKAPAASWPGIMLRAKLDEPDWKGVNKAF